MAKSYIKSTNTDGASLALQALQVIWDTYQPTTVHPPISALMDGLADLVDVDSQPHPPQHSVRDLPDRLRGMGIEHALKTVSCTFTEQDFIQQQSDQEFRHRVKKDLSQMLAKEAMNVAKFTQVAEPHNNAFKVIGRVVIMTEDQLNHLIRMIR